MENRLLLLFFSLLFFTTCTDKAGLDIANSEETEFDGNKYIKTKQVGWLKMDLFLKPTAHFVSRYISKNPKDSLGLEEVKKEAEEMMYFDLRLSVTEGEGMHIENYGLTSSFGRDQRIQYLAFSMQSDIYLSQGEHIVPCDIYHFERNYSISPHRTFIVGFPRKNILKGEPVTFVFDSQYFQTGPLKISYSSKDIFDSTQIEN